MNQKKIFLPTGFRDILTNESNLQNILKLYEILDGFKSFIESISK